MEGALTWSSYVSHEPMGHGWTRYDLHRPKRKPAKRRKGAK